LVARRRDVVDGMTFGATIRSRQAFATSGLRACRTGRAARPSGRSPASGPGRGCPHRSPTCSVFPTLACSCRRPQRTRGIRSASLSERRRASCDFAGSSASTRRRARSNQFSRPRRSVSSKTPRVTSRSGSGASAPAMAAFMARTTRRYRKSIATKRCPPGKMMQLVTTALPTTSNDRRHRTGSQRALQEQVSTGATSATVLHLERMTFACLALDLDAFNGQYECREATPPPVESAAGSRWCVGASKTGPSCRPAHLSGSARRADKGRGRRLLRTISVA